MSLKSRLRISIVGLVITVVVALSGLYLRTLVETMFSDIGQRGRMVANDAASLVELRVREQMTGPAPATLEQAKLRWAAIVRQDPILPSMLERMLRTDDSILEILVLSDDGEILCGGIGHAGRYARQLPEFDRWRQKPFWTRLWEVRSSGGDYQVSIPLGAAGADNRPVFRVQAVISSVFVRSALERPMERLGLVSMLSLIGSLLLAVAVARFVSQPLERMARQIDQISAGAAPPPPPPARPMLARATAAPEFTAVESKLTALGQQYRGAQADAVQLRHNLEWMLERLEQAVFLTDAQGRLTLVGPSAERLVGKPRVEMMGAPLASVFPPGTHLGALLERALARSETLRDYSVLLEREADDPVRILLNVEPLLHIDTGQGAGALITLRDADTRRQLETQFDMTTRLAAINRVTGGVAHEIKNPLNAIALHLEVLKSKIRELDGSDAVDNEVRVIAREITRLDRVVKTFLDFTRPVEFEVRDVDLGSVAREVATLVSPQAAARGVHLELEGAGPPAIVAGDRDMLLRAVLNVVNNAVESMSQAGTVRIGVRARPPSEWSLRVADQGCGIPAGKRDRIFDLYYTTKPNGSGIGLAMTFRVVQLHHGRIEIASEEGQGTTFQLIFPAVEALPADRFAKDREAAVAGGGDSSGKAAP